MRFRKLRIAWSVGGASRAVLLIVLWVRSYYFCDGLHLKLSNARCVVLSAMCGESALAIQSTSVMPPNRIWWFNCFEVEYKYPWGPTLIVHPIWSLIIVATAMGVAPWLRWRFSLRTLLIATTLVAVWLGLLVWLG